MRLFVFLTVVFLVCTIARVGAQCVNPVVGDHQTVVPAIPEDCSGTGYSLMDTNRESPVQFIRIWWRTHSWSSPPPELMTRTGTRFIGIEVVFFNRVRRSAGVITDSGASSASITLRPGERIEGAIEYSEYSYEVVFPTYFKFTTNQGQTFTAGQLSPQTTSSNIRYNCDECFLTGFFGRQNAGISLRSLGFHVAGQKKPPTGVRLSRLTYPLLNSSTPLTPNKGFQAILCNDGNTPQKLSYSYTKTEGNHYSHVGMRGSDFEANFEAEITYKKSMKFGVPILAQKVVSFEGSVGYTHNTLISEEEEQETELNTEKTVSSSIAVEVHPRTRVFGSFKWFEYYTALEWRAKMLYEYEPFKGVIVFDCSGITEATLTTAINGGWQAQALRPTEKCT